MKSISNLLAIVCAQLLTLGVFAHGAAAKRVALVIGNAAYSDVAKLKNPVNDARDMAAALQARGVDVIAGYDLDKAGMDRQIRAFAERLTGAEAAIFFYAGHGLQVEGRNYLAPIDAELRSAASLDFEMIPLELVQRTMEREAKTNLLFLDACRDNPLARNLARAMGTRSAVIGKGLAAIEAGVGTLISFSTQPGNVALDGNAQNSPYSAPLSRRIASSKEDLGAILIEVRSEVITATAGRQVPWEHSALTGKFFFDALPAPAAGKANAGLAESTRDSFELAFWSAVKDSDDPRVLRTYLERYPSGTFAGLARVLVSRLENQERSRESSSSPGGSTASLGQSDHSQRKLPSAVDVPFGDVPQASRAALIVDLQRQLDRVGCSPGPADGQWGERTEAALKRYRAERQVERETAYPDQSLLTMITREKGRVCALACGADEVAADGRCKPKSLGTAGRSRPAAASRRPEDGGGGSRQQQGSAWAACYSRSWSENPRLTSGERYTWVNECLARSGRGR